MNPVAVVWQKWSHDIVDKRFEVQSLSLLNGNVTWIRNGDVNLPDRRAAVPIVIAYHFERYHGGCQELGVLLSLLRN